MWLLVFLRSRSERRPLRLQVPINAQLNDDGLLMVVFGIVEPVAVAIDPGQVQTELVKSEQIGRQLSDCDPDDDRVVNVAVMEVGVAERDVPSVRKSALDRSQDGRLRSVARTDEHEERLIDRETPRHLLDATEVADVDAPDLHVAYLCVLGLAFDHTRRTRGANHRGDITRISIATPTALPCTYPTLCLRHAGSHMRCTTQRSSCRRRRRSRAE